MQHVKSIDTQIDVVSNVTYKVIIKYISKLNDTAKKLELILKFIIVVNLNLIVRI